MKVYYTFFQIQNIIKDASRIINKEFQPDFIIAIGGGGYIPARILRTFTDEVKKAKLLGVTVESYSDDNISHSIREIQWLNTKNLQLFEGKNVLIVDEIDDTRKTLHYVVEKLQNDLKAIDVNCNLGIFVIHNKIKEKTSFDNVKYFAGEEVPDNWIVYPWE